MEASQRGQGHDAARVEITVELRAEEVERIAQRAAEIALDALIADERADVPYLTVPEVARYLCCRRQRVDDLLSQGRLTRVKEGARTLVRRAEIEAYLRGEPSGRLADRQNEGASRRRPLPPRAA